MPGYFSDPETQPQTQQLGVLAQQPSIPAKLLEGVLSALVGNAEAADMSKPIVPQQKWRLTYMPSGTIQWYNSEKEAREQFANGKLPAGAILQPFNVRPK